MSAKYKCWFLAVTIFQIASWTQAQAGDVRFAVRTGMPQHIIFVNEICKVIGKEITDNNGTCGPIVQDNPLAPLAQGKAHFALIGSRYQYYASTKGMKHFRSVISLQLWPLIFLGDPKLHTSADDLLRNGKIVYFSRGFPNRQNNVFVQSCPDCSPDCSKNCKCVSCLSSDTLNLSRVKQLSGLGLILPFDDALMNKVLSSTDLMPLSFSQRFISHNKGLRKASYLFPASIAISVSKQQTMVSTLAMSLTVISHKNVSIDLGYRTAKGIAKNIDRIKNAIPKIRYLTTRQTFKAGLTMSIQEGASKFFEE